MKTKIHTLILSIFSMLLLVPGFANGQSLDLKIMSYNMQQPFGTNWDGRKAGAAQILNTYQGDVVGTQELVNYQREYVLANTSGYSVYGQGRDCGDAGEGSWVLYKNAKFTLDAANSGNFWFSDNPNVCGRGWDPNYNRICTYVRLIDKATGKAFYIFNAHFPTPDQATARTKSMQLLCARAASRAFPNDPVIFTGDFNSIETEPQIAYIKSGAANPSKMRDSYRDLYPTGNVTTGFGVKFDYIFIENKTTVSAIASQVITSPVASDHMPITATIRLGVAPPPVTLPIPGKVEAESFSAMNGIQTEATSDLGGGTNVGYLNPGDWLEYKVEVATAGAYKLDFRIAALAAAGQLQFSLNGTPLLTQNFPATGGWQNWQTVSTTLNLNAGIQTIRLTIMTGDFNINWMNFISANPNGTTIQAEAFTAMAGIQTETTSDAGGGLNVGYIDAGDWMAYSNVNFTSSGNYTVEYRVASLSGGKISCDLNGGAIQLGSVTIPATGGWQTWTTVSQTITITAAGTYSVGIFAQSGGWNLNWFRITKQTAGAARILQPNESNDNLTETAFACYPNPATTTLYLNASENFSGGQAKVVDALGSEVLSVTLDSAAIDVSSLKSGMYTVVISSDGKSLTKRFMKQ